MVKICVIEKIVVPLQAETNKAIFSMKKIWTILALMLAAGLQAQVTILPPAEIVSKAAYQFEQDGITVSCTQGAIYPATHEWNTSGVDYFGCNAGQTITFSTDREIKGLVVNGWVKKFFSATPTSGTIEFLSPDLDDQAGDPVIVVRDIDAQSVSISCDKQLRCYNVVVYFDENPTDTIAGATPPAEGEVFFFDYNTSNAIYDPSYTTATRPYNYYLYLWDSENEDVYVGLDIYTAEKDNFEGMYSTDDGTMTGYSFYQFGEAYEDYSMAVEGAMVINAVDAGYSISGYITCENGNTYNFSFEGTVLLDEEEEGVEIVESQKSKVESQKTMQNGILLIERNGKKYDAAGRGVKE